MLTSVVKNWKTISYSIFTKIPNLIKINQCSIDIFTENLLGRNILLAVPCDYFSSQPGIFYKSFLKVTL